VNSAAAAISASAAAGGEGRQRGDSCGCSQVTDTPSADGREMLVAKGPPFGYDVSGAADEGAAQ
jgi:hypothetical protein